LGTSKQDVLISATTIKTINGTTILRWRYSYNGRSSRPAQTITTVSITTGTLGLGKNPREKRNYKQRKTLINIAVNGNTNFVAYLKHGAGAIHSFKAGRTALL
jgi:hypothetical protein